MGLDLTIREQTNFRTDDKGRTTWTTVELYNMRNCWEVLNELGNKLENGFSNCSTVSFEAVEFLNVLNTLKEELKYDKDNRDLKYEIEELEDFIKQEDITEDTERAFEVHAWW